MIKQVELLNVGVETNFTGKRVEPRLPGNVPDVVERAVHPPGDHPAHYQGLPNTRILTPRLDGVERPPTRGGREDPDPALEFLPLGGEPFPDDAAHAAFLGDAEAGGAVQAEGAS